MTYAGYARTVFVNILVIALVLAVFNAAPSRFDKILVSILTLLYVNLIGYATASGRTSTTQFLVLRADLLSFRKEHGKADVLPEEAQMEQLHKRMADTEAEYGLNSVFVVIIALIAVYMLITNL